MNPKLFPLRIFQALTRPFNGREIFGRKLGDYPLVECFYEGTRKMLIPRDVVSEINGYKMKTNYSMGGIARDIVEKHEYEPISTKLFIEVCRHGQGDIIDVGANIGYYTLLAARILPDDLVYAFEPEAENFINLCENVNLNHLTNVKTVPLALSDKTGTVILYTSEKESGEHNIIGSHGLKEATSDAYEIATDTLDHLWYSNAYHPVRMIKIDVEGAEIKVLEGARKIINQFHPTILIECWEEGLLTDHKTIEDLIGLLSDLGYINIRMIDEFKKDVYKANPQLIRKYTKEHNFSVNLIATDVGHIDCRGKEIK